MWLDRLERQVLAEQHIAASLMAAGAEGVQMPDMAEREQFLREWLYSPLEPSTQAAQLDPELRELRAALGYSGA